MMDEPGSFSGMDDLAQPAARPLASQRTSLAIFIKLTASPLSAPWAYTRASQLARASNLFGAVTRFNPVKSASSLATAWAPAGAFQTSAHGRAAKASSHKWGMAAKVALGMVWLCHPARYLLPQSPAGSRPAGGCGQSSRCRQTPQPWRPASCATHAGRATVCGSAHPPPPGASP